MFEKLEIFSAAELEIRYQVDLQSYVSEIQIESRTLGDMALNHIVPTAIQYQNTLIQKRSGIQRNLWSNIQKTQQRTVAVVGTNF